MQGFLCVFASLRENGFRSLLLSLFIITVLAMTLSCATISLPDDATSDEKHAALCVDATVGLATAEAMLNGHLSTEAELYWTSFASGCRIAIAAYCEDAGRI